MRYLLIAAAAAFLALPFAAPAEACNAAKAQASTADYSAAKKKPARKSKSKVEYMRAVPAK